MSRARSFSLLLAVLVAPFIHDGVPAALAASETQAQPVASPSFQQCVYLAAGPHAATFPAGEGPPRYAGADAALDAGWGWCPQHIELGARFRLVPGPRLFMLAAALQLRTHTRMPAGPGFEAGYGLRLGYDYVNVSEADAGYDPFHGPGFFASTGPDISYWLDERWAFVAALDVSLAFARGEAKGRDDAMLGLALTAGGVFRF